MASRRRLIVAVVLGIVVGLLTAHWNVGTTGIYKDPQITVREETP